MSPRVAEAIVDSVLDNLLRRAGFDEFWYSVEEDIREEIRDDLVAEVAVYVGVGNGK